MTGAVVTTDVHNPVPYCVHTEPRPTIPYTKLGTFNGVATVTFDCRTVADMGALEVKWAVRRELFLPNSDLSPCTSWMAVLSDLPLPYFVL